jgi:hypothetical protein
MSARPRRRLTALDDPLERAATRAPDRRASDGETQAIFVRVPTLLADALARAAFELKLHKQEVVAALLSRHVDPHTSDGLAAVRRLVEEYRGASR